MNTKEFLAHVLPDDGLVCLAFPSNGTFRHRFYDDKDKAAADAIKIDSAGYTVYFGCASYIQSDTRKATNVASARSLWLDVDCGEGKPYADAREGLKALCDFFKALELPAPTIVQSGTGLHVYWRLDRDVTPDEWRSLANGLKQSARDHGFRADPARTSDIASVLRPVGTHHRKGKEIPVKLLRAGQEVSVSALQEKFGWLGSYPQAADTQINSDLSGGIEYPPANAELIAERCGIMQLMRDTQGNVDQPTWYHSLQILAACQDGEKFAHGWSSGHPDYSEEETNTKFAQAKQHRPTTCQKLADYQPQICEVCPFNGKINSPIALGYENAPGAPAQRFVEVAPEEVPVELPFGYKASKDIATGNMSLMVCLEKDDNNQPIWTPFCDSFFYPVSRIHTKEGNMLEFDLVLPKNVHRRFLVNTATIAEGGKSLAGELGKMEIVSRPGMKSQIDAYLTRWIDKMRQEADEVETYTRFGWYEKDFLVGETLLTPAGPRQVLLRGNAALKKDAVATRGDFEEWKQVINGAYNYPGQEALQYQVLLGFASPLFALFKELGGITVYAHSEGSGVGKTTAQRAALSVWGNWQELQMAEGKTTVNALQVLMGTYHNLPVLFDELTNQSYEEASRLVFDTSSGRAKAKLNRDGSLKENVHNWSTIMMASGNNTITEKLANHRLNASAEIARAFEFTVTNCSKLSPNEARDLFPKLLDNYGHAGIVFMDYVVRNYDRVADALLRVQKVFNEKLNVNNTERYWSALQACVITALKICRKTNILFFDPVAMQNWIEESLRANRHQMNDTVDSSSDTFGRMLTDIWQGILVTLGEGDLRRNAIADVVQHPRGILTGRAIVGLSPRENTTLLLNAIAVRDWCNRRGASAKELFAAGVAEGWVSPKPVRYSLGRGTTQYATISSQVKCWEINLRKLGAGAIDSSIAQKVRLIEVKETDDDVEARSSRDTESPQS